MARAPNGPRESALHPYPTIVTLGITPRKLPWRVFPLSGGVSEKHLRDIGDMMKVQGGALDRAYIVEWAQRLGVAEVWELHRRRVDRGS